VLQLKLSDVAMNAVICGIVGSIVTGIPCASAQDKEVKSKNTASSPGRFNTETCLRPEYPERELKQNHQGPVTLRFFLDADGAVKQSLIQTSSGYPTLDEAALLAISKCRFSPMLINGRPGEGWTTVQYVWQLLKSSH
jgi:TonB family protein